MRAGRTVRFGAGWLAGLMLVVAGSACADETPGRIRIAISPWVGYEANAAVIAHLLEKKLGYTVEKKPLKEEVAWQGFETGAVDVVLENWGHEDLKATYVEQKKAAVSLGLTGNKGIIGWYVPEWMVKRYPDITDWKNLNKYANLFRTAQSGGKGQLLDGDPSFVTNDEALVANLRLNFTVVYSGSEVALINAARQATQRKTPLLFYFYEPQWLFSQMKFVKVNLPAYKDGCDGDVKKVACDYPPYALDKIVSKRFAARGDAAYRLIKRFEWTNEDQNQVAADIANAHMTPDQAAKKWTDTHPGRWQPWLAR